MPKFRKKPVVIEAVQWDGHNPGEIQMFSANAVCPYLESDSQNGFFPITKLSIETLEGTMIAEKGDWIIKGIKGEFYPCKPDIFEATYEEVGK